MGVEVAIIAGSLIAAGAGAWSSHQAQTNQAKRQKSLLQDAERKEADIKKQADEAKAKASEDARKRVIKKQRSASQTILTGAGGVAEEEATEKKSLLGG